MSNKEQHSYTAEDIKTELTRLRRRMYDLRCQAATEKIEDPSQFKKVRGDIARLMTEQRSREIQKAGNS